MTGLYAPEISVIMAVYNGAKYLEESMGSILRQTYRDFEIIVVDDGSTDETFQMLREMVKGDPRIKLIRNETNLRLAASLNRGIEAARAPLVARMDADDYASPSRLQIQKEYMDNNPDIAISGGALELYENPGIFWVAPLENDCVRARLLFESCLFHPTVIFRKSAFGEFSFRYDESMLPAEDYALWASMAKCKEVKFGNVEDVIVRYRIYPKRDRSAYKSEQRLAASGVRCMLLRHLGMEVGNDEFELHEALSYRKGLPKGRALNDAAIWLKRMAKACTESSYCSLEAIEREAEGRWRDAYFGLRDQSIGKGVEYVCSSLAKRKILALRDVIGNRWRARDNPVV